MWISYYSKETKSTKERVWQVWSDVNNWNRWDTSVESSSITGIFENGTLGTLKTKGGPKTRFQIVNCVENTSFTSRSKLPLCTMDVVHEILDDGDKLLVKHSICMSGLLTFLFKNLIGRNAAKGLPEAINNLVEMLD